ncbi:MAG: sodium/sugar symporter [Cytophagales bacterium]|nr:sodium/sugar symporter [Cytophagales bacterium]MDW8383311.1 sodium/sugar symporter [Flammeovirgaceae bacterium]
MENFATIDIIVFSIYCIIIVGVGLWVSRDKSGHEKTSEDYFLAGKALPWWAIGASLIASNISAEQFIGMSGSGFALGLAISTYEWMAAATLVIVGKFFLPIFLEKKIFTMPQFLEMRYDSRVRTILAVFWLAVYVFVNLTSVLYLGALSINTVFGIDLHYAIFALALFALVYSIYGGLMAVAWTDIIQVIFLVVGGLATTYLALNLVAPQKALLGFFTLIEKAPQHFHMILESSHKNYIDLPGITVLIGGMWIVNLNYWGCNQYITQRALAAKSLEEAQKGVVFAGYLKLLMPLIVVIPGIAAYVLYHEGVDVIVNNMNIEGTPKPDKAYPALLQLLPPGLKGAAFAALSAAIVSSLASMMNSTATIFTLDIYKHFFDKNASNKRQVAVGRIVSFVSLLIACAVAPLLGKIEQAFQFIQEFTGLVSPGIFVIFVFGFFWKKATANGAYAVAITTLPLSFGLKIMLPSMAFLDRMGIVFVLLSFIMMGVSAYDHRSTDEHKDDKLLLTKTLFHFALFLVTLVLFLVAQSKGVNVDSILGKILIHLLVIETLILALSALSTIKDDKKSIMYGTHLFVTGRAFNIGASGILLILTVLYAVFW